MGGRPAAGAGESDESGKATRYRHPDEDKKDPGEETFKMSALVDREWMAEGFQDGDDPFEFSDDTGESDHDKNEKSTDRLGSAQPMSRQSDSPRPGPLASSGRASRNVPLLVEVKAGLSVCREDDLDELLDLEKSLQAPPASRARHHPLSITCLLSHYSRAHSHALTDAPPYHVGRFSLSHLVLYNLLR